MRTAFLLASLIASTASAQPLTTAFTFQGQVQESGLPAAGTFDIRFRLYDALSGGAQVGPTLCVNDLTVAGGQFTTLLDFGAVFAGSRRYMEMDIRPDTGLPCADATGFTTLAPRSEVTAAPNSSFALNAATATNAANLNGQPASFYTSATNLTGTVPDARLSTNVPRLNATNSFTNNVTAPLFIGALSGNATSATTASNAVNLNGQPASFFQNAGNLNTGTLADARLSPNVPLLSGNNAYAGSNTFSQNTTFQAAVITEVGRIGSITPNPVRLMVNNNTALMLASGPAASGESGLQHPTIVVGNNLVDPGNLGAGILSGGALGAPNQINASSDHAVIAGGVSNLVQGMTATIGGGFDNTAQGTHATIGGGAFNAATASVATIAGGQLNESSGAASTVGGGSQNRATGDFSTVAGGGSNIAGGDFSFAGGQNAVVRDRIASGDVNGDEGSFVWADASTSGTFATTGANQFLVRATGGVGIGTNNPKTPFHVMDGASGTTSVSGSASAIFERNADNSIMLLSPESNSRSILFGSPSNFAHGGILYSNLTGMSFLTGSGITRVRISANGNTGVGTASPQTALHVVRGAQTVISSPASIGAIFEGSGASHHVAIMGSTANTERGIAFGTNASPFHGGIYYTDAGGMQFRTNNNITNMLIDDGGLVRIGVGTEIPDAQLHVESSNSRVMKVDRGVSDGELLSWARDDAPIGSVSVAAGVVTYGAFTGVHYATLEAPIETYTLVSMTGMNTVLGNNNTSKIEGETVYGVRASVKPNDPAVLGVYMGSLDAEDYNHATPIAQIAAVGNADMIVVDNGTGEAITPGDYLISSSVTGAAMKLDPAKFPVGHVIAKAAGKVDWSSVPADASGVRRAKISVLFTSFTHTDPSLAERLTRLEELLGQK